MDISNIENIELSYLSIDDYEELKQVMIEIYTDKPGAYWTKNQIEKLIKLFPEGQVVIKVNGKLAGCALSIIVDYKKFGDNHTYKKITGNSSFSTHNPNGDVLYATVMGAPTSGVRIKSLGTAAKLLAAPIDSVELLGGSTPVRWAQTPEALAIEPPAALPKSHRHRLPHHRAPLILNLSEYVPFFR